MFHTQSIGTITSFIPSHHIDFNTGIDLTFEVFIREFRSSAYQIVHDVQRRLMRLLRQLGYRRR